MTLSLATNENSRSLQEPWPNGFLCKHALSLYIVKDAPNILTVTYTSAHVWPTFIVFKLDQVES